MDLVPKSLVEHSKEMRCLQCFLMMIMRVSRLTITVIKVTLRAKVLYSYESDHDESSSEYNDNGSDVRDNNREV